MCMSVCMCTEYTIMVFRCLFQIDNSVGYRRNPSKRAANTPSPNIADAKDHIWVTPTTAIQIIAPQSFYTRVLEHRILTIRGLQQHAAFILRLVVVVMMCQTSGFLICHMQDPFDVLTWKMQRSVFDLEISFFFGKIAILRNMLDHNKMRF